MTRHTQNPAARDLREPGWQQQFGDGFAQGVALVLTPMVFGALGFLLDRVLGTGRVFMLALVVFAAIGTMVNEYYRYCARVDAENEGKPWTRL